MASLSSFHSSVPSVLKSFPISNPNSNINIPCRTLTVKFSLNSEQNSNSPPLTEKKSLAVATGELFLGLASRIIKRRNSNEVSAEVPITMFRDTESFDRESFFSWPRNGVAAIVDESQVVWEQRLKDMEAERARKKVTSPGFSFSAAGLLFPYHLGVAQFLIEKGYIKDTTPLAGASAGAIVCAVIASGSSMHEALKATKILAEDCRLRGTAFRLGAVLRDLLVKFLPDDVHIRSNGRVRVIKIYAVMGAAGAPPRRHFPTTALRSVAVTQILWRPRGLLVDQFDSKEDLINAVFTSSFIPGYLAPRPATLFRNRVCIDGGLTLFMPPTSASKTVRVCAFPIERLGLQGIGISPDCNPKNRASARELLNWALEPAEDSVLDRLFELGYLDAAVWGEQNPVEEIVTDDSSPGSLSISI